VKGLNTCWLLRAGFALTPPGHLRGVSADSKAVRQAKRR